MNRDIITTLLLQGRRDLALAYARHFVGAKRGLFYHGTSSVFAKRILSEGFVPDPKKKIWDPETGTSESYMGTYFTSYPHTAGRYAGGAVRKFGGFEVIFEVQLETKTGLFDEDEIFPVALSVMKVTQERYPVAGSFQTLAENILNDKRMLGAVVESSIMDWIGTGTENDTRRKKFAQLYREQYGETPINPKYWDAVYGAAKKAVMAVLEEMRDTGKASGGPRYRKAMTELHKALNLSRYGPKQKGGPHNIRVTEPIGFRGANKIVAAIGDRWQMPMDGEPRTRTINILYGNPSRELLKQRRDEKVVILKGWPKPKAKEKMAAHVTAGTTMKMMAGGLVIGDRITKDAHGVKAGAVVKEIRVKGSGKRSVMVVDFDDGSSVTVGRWTTFEIERGANASASNDYMMGHRPSKTAPLHNLTEKGVMPDDVYTDPQYYADMSQRSYQESFVAIQKARGKANAKVTVYRAGPVAELNTGDWVSLSRSYAKLESETEGVPVHSFKVKVRDVWWPGDDFNEFGYFGPAIKQDVKALRAQLEQEKKQILKTGRLPNNPVLYHRYRASKYFNQYGTTPKQQSSAYYDFISDVLNGNVTAATDDDRMAELMRQQAKKRKKMIGIDGDRKVTDEIEVRQTAPGKVWSFLFQFKSPPGNLEIVRVNGVKRARAMRDVLRNSGLRDFQKLRELAFKWRKANPR
jgi:hypothetical protein